MKWTNDYIAKPFVPLRFHFSLKGALLMAKLSLFIHLSPSLYIHCLSRTWLVAMAPLVLLHKLDFEGSKDSFQKMCRAT
jgi:hypothetical protein